MTERTTGGVRAPIRVLLADDQRIVREGLGALLRLLPEVEVAGAAADGEEALVLAAQLQPDIVLMDLRMPRCDGVEATRRLRERSPGIEVIVLTTYADDRSVIEALRAGARGYLTKDASAAEIHQALKRVISGEAAIAPAVQRHLVDAIADGVLGASGSQAGPQPAQQFPDRLTPREAEVLSLIAEGLSNTEIAERLAVSETTSRAISITCWPRQALATAQRRSAMPTGTGSPRLTLHSPGRLANGRPG